MRVQYKYIPWRMNLYNALANNSWVIPYDYDGNALKYNVSYIIREVFLYQDTQA